MKIDRILFPVETLGPGKRLVLWTKGCSKHCFHCANPELWDSGKKDISVQKIVQMINNINNETQIDGITVSGGDPLEQADELTELLREMKKITDDILVYTGFVYDDIKKEWDKDIINSLEKNISVLIDGPYIEKYNDNFSALKGSSNQRIIFFDEKYRKKYEKYLTSGRTIQNFYMGKKLISVGIHNKE